MKISSKFSLALLAGTILSTPANYAAAATLTPTLDTIKAEAADLSGNFALMKLTGDLPEGAAEVEIAGVKYYFTPTGDDAALLKTLAGTVAGNLKEDENGIFEFDGKKYSFDVAAIPESVFEYTEGTAEDYNFTIEEADAEGNLTTKYYKVVLKPETFATSENIKWGTTTAVETPGMTDSDLSDDNQVKGVVKINLPNNKSEYYEYTYTKPADYEIVTGKPLDFKFNEAPGTAIQQPGGIAINNPEGETYEDIKSKVYADNKVTGSISGGTSSKKNELYLYGGVIYNAGEMENINADFINNSVEATAASYSYADAYGGAIYNAENAIISNITADFIGNYVSGSNNAYGGAINNDGTIGNITGDFVGNYTSGTYAYGGAINNDGIIGDITGDFIGNYAYGGYAGGGAIYNFSTIGNITGNFIGNYAQSGGNLDNGGAIYNVENATIGDITGDFIGNYANYNGGAIYNVENATIGDITGDFIGNYSGHYGGTIYNYNGIIGDITGDFIGNYSGLYSGAIYNDVGTIGDITGDFIGNYADDGGTIYNYNGTIGDITGDFIGNYAYGEHADGGAIYNRGTIGDITGDFIGNYAYGEHADGGAISNYNGTIGDITGDFIGNYAGVGGAIYNRGAIGDITGDFIGNYAMNESSSAEGGAISNSGTIGNITGDFIGNYAQSESNFAYGGAIANGNQFISATIGDITGDFIGNYAQSENAQAFGGAIANMFGNFSITGNILNNYAQSENAQAYGGAILSTIGADIFGTMEISTPSVSSKGQDIFLSGNYTEDTRGKIYNALHVMILPEEIKELAGISADAVDFAFDTSGGGSITINDNIDGSLMATSGDSPVTDDRSAQYNLAFRGDDVLNDDGRTTQYIAINNDIINAGKVTVDNTTLKFGSYQHEDEKAVNWNGQGAFVPGEGTDAVTSLSLTNAAFDLYNGYMETVNLKGWNATDSYLHVDVDVENLTADILNINGNVEGTTKLVLYPTSAKDITGKSIVFAQSSNDTTGTTDSFTVYRVYRSPYMFKVGMTGEGTTEHEWYLTMTDEKNEFAGVEPGEQPDPGVPDVDIPDINIPDINIPTAPVYGEVVAYGALPAAALEQTRNMVDNIGGQIKNSRVYTRSCSFVDGYWNGEPYYNLWVNPTYYTSNIDSPFAIDADIWGIEAGGDIQHDIHNRLGIFVSYRQGEYDMNGNGDKYRSPVGSEIDIDSYIAGLYYRYDNNNWYAFATLYGGIQEADIKTDDGMKSDTDGVEFGASAEVGYDYALTDSVTLTPELGVFYTQVNYDDATDSVGKSASYDDARQIELEAGVKLAKTFMTDESFANVYVKPSVVQTIVDGDEVSITGLGDVEALDDATLGRIEIGGRYGFTTNLSAYGWANYTFGSDYDATTFGLGLNYAF